MNVTSILCINVADLRFRLLKRGMIISFENGLGKAILFYEETTRVFN